MRIGESHIAEFNARRALNHNIAAGTVWCIHKFHEVGCVYKVVVRIGNAIKQRIDTTIKLRQKVANGNELTNCQVAVNNLLRNNSKHTIARNVFECTRANMRPEETTRIRHVLLLRAAALLDHAIDKMALQIIDFNFERGI